MTPTVTFNSRLFSGSAAVTQSWTSDRDCIAVVTVPFGDAVISSDPKATSADFVSSSSAKVWLEKIVVSTNTGNIQIPLVKDETIYVALSLSSTVVFQLFT